MAQNAYEKYIQVLRCGLFLPHVILRQRMKKTIKYGSRTRGKLFEKDGSGKAFIYVQYWKTSTVRSKNSLHTQREAYFWATRTDISKSKHDKEKYLNIGMETSPSSISYSFGSALYKAGDSMKPVETTHTQNTQTSENVPPLQRTNWICVGYLQYLNIFPRVPCYFYIGSILLSLQIHFRKANRTTDTTYHNHTHISLYFHQIYATSDNVSKRDYSEINKPRYEIGKIQEVPGRMIKWR